MTTPLEQMLRQYATYRSLASNTTYQMSRAIRSYGEFLGRQPTLCDLEDEKVSSWLAELQSRLSRATVAGRRTNLLVLWRDIAAQGRWNPPGRIRRAPWPKPQPIAWTMDELRRILQFSRNLTGKFPSGDLRSDYCEALILVAYDTGLRRSDLWELKRQQIRPDGTILIRQSKTQTPHQPKLRLESLSALLRLSRDNPLACPYRSTGCWYRFWREKVISPAGVRHGALQQIRRTGASHLAREHPHAVQRYLGHKTAEMQEHYVDQSIANPQQHLPPGIE